MKIFSFLTVFLLAGLFLVPFVYYAKAGIHGVCVEDCKVGCSAGKYRDRCEGETGTAKKECITMANIVSGCCYIECLEEICGDEVPEQSTVCDILDEACGDPD